MRASLALLAFPGLAVPVPAVQALSAPEGAGRAVQLVRDPDDSTRGDGLGRALVALFADVHVPDALAHAPEFRVEVDLARRRADGSLHSAVNELARAHSASLGVA